MGVHSPKLSPTAAEVEPTLKAATSQGRSHVSPGASLVAILRFTELKAEKTH